MLAQLLQTWSQGDQVCRSWPKMLCPRKRGEESALAAGCLGHRLLAGGDPGHEAAELPPDRLDLM